ncbi:hypothetical protein OAN13_04775 [Opitutales bacterium]|nr:hypothetical protein [Opitutales bacterium]
MKFRICLTLFFPVVSMWANNTTVDFEKEVFPLFKERCIECHQAPQEKNGRLIKPKAGLRMDGLAHLMFGSDDGPILVPNHPSKSPLYNRVNLPSDDDDRMPPKRDPLTVDQKDLIRRWIGQGADFGSWQGATDGIEDLVRKDAFAPEKVPQFVTFYLNLAKGIKPVSSELLEVARKQSGLHIRTIGKGSPLLEARAVTQFEKVTDEKVAALFPLAGNLVHLDLRNTALTSAGCATVSKLTNLVHLNLRGCSVKDSGVQQLTTLKNLQSLNLGQTQISPQGLVGLIKLPALTRLNLWESKAVTAGLAPLVKVRPNLEIIK